MKKFASIIIAVVVCLGCVTPAFADMGTPYFSEYTAIVTNPDGAKNADEYASEEIVIPYGTRITVTGEYDYKDTGVTLVNCRYGDSLLEININDISKELDKTEDISIVKLKSPVKMVVINKDGAAIRKGAAESYETIGNIPYGTEITLEYANQYETNYIPWGYIIYNGISGWINVLMYNHFFDFALVLTEDSLYTGKIITLKDNMQLMEYPREYYLYDWDFEKDERIETPNNKYVSDKIPAGTELTFKYYYQDAKNIYVYTEYNGKGGWIITDESYNGFTITDTAAGFDGIITATGNNELSVYSEPDNKGKKLDVTISECEVISADFYGTCNITKDGQLVTDSDSDWDYDNIEEELIVARVNIGGKQGWVTASRNDCVFSVINSSYGNYRKANSEITAYESADTNSAKAFTIPKGGELEIHFDTKYFADAYSDDEEQNTANTYLYVGYADKLGWIPGNADIQFDDNISKHITVTPVNVYAEESTTSELLFTIPAFEEFEVTDHYHDSDSDTYFAYVSYGGSEGWAKSENFGDYSGYIFRALTDMATLVAPEGFADCEIFTIDRGEEVKSLYYFSIGDNSYSLIEYNGKKGVVSRIRDSNWLMTGEISDSNVENDNAQTVSSSRNIVLACVAGAVVVSLSALVMIIYLKKKKESKAK